MALEGRELDRDRSGDRRRERALRATRPAGLDARRRDHALAEHLALEERPQIAQLLGTADLARAA